MVLYFQCLFKNSFISCGCLQAISPSRQPCTIPCSPCNRFYLLWIVYGKALFSHLCSSVFLQFFQAVPYGRTYQCSRSISKIYYQLRCGLVFSIMPVFFSPVKFGILAAAGAPHFAPGTPYQYAITIHLLIPGIAGFIVYKTGNGGAVFAQYHFRKTVVKPFPVLQILGKKRNILRCPKKAYTCFASDLLRVEIPHAEGPFFLRHQHF